MKKSLLYNLLLLLAVMIMGVGQAWADEFTWNLNELYQNNTKVTAKTVTSAQLTSLTFTDENKIFSLTITRKSGNSPGFYTSSGYWRFYQNDIVTIKALNSGCVITKIVATKNGSTAVAVNEMSNGTWSGEAESVDLTGNGTNKWDKLTITYTAPAAAPAAPTFSEEAGEFSEAFDLTISAEEGASIYYTLDGTDPTAESTEYEAAINISATTTVKAIAVKNEVSSEVATATYTYVNASLQTPTFTVPESVDIKVGQTDGKITVETNSDGEITFVSSSANLLVDEDGSLLADKAGSYTVTVNLAETATYRAATKECTVNVTKTSTNITINDALIENKDVFVSTEAGILDAVVKAGDNVILDAEVTWTSSNTGVATIDEDGIVTLVGKGTTTITATYAGDETYEGSTETYVLNVTSSAPKPETLTLTFEDGEDRSYWTIENIGTSNAAITAHGGSKYGANINESGNGVATASITTVEPFEAPGLIKFYISKASNNTTASSWIVSVSSDNNLWTEVESFDAKGMSKGVWVEETADLSEYNNVYVRISYGSSNAIRCIDDITLAKAVTYNVATPTFSLAEGTYEEVKTTTISCETEGATIYYTTDGSEPTAESTEYTGEITVNETMTIKAIAIKDAESSVVASATYTIDLPLTTIAEIKQQTSGTAVKVVLTGAQVVYVNGKDLFVRDNTGALDLYNSGVELETGDIFNATIEATYKPYNGMPELTTFTTENITKTGNETVVATVVATAEDALANVCNLVKFESVQLDAEGNIGETGLKLYDKYNVDYTINEGKDADVSGIVVPFNSTVQICPRFETDIVYLENSEAVSISDAKYATFCSTHDLDFTAVDAIAAYKATVTGDVISFVRVYEVPAGEGVLLHSTANTAVDAINVPFCTSTPDALSDNQFVAVTENIASLAFDDKNYVLSIGSNGIGFYHANNTPVAAGKAYLQVPAGIRVIGLNLVDDETTAINNVMSMKKAENAEIYNLQGQRVSNAKKGLYIIGGKKVVVR